MIDEIEERLNRVFDELKRINNKIEKIKEEMDDARIPNNRNKISE